MKKAPLVRRKVRALLATAGAVGIGINSSARADFTINQAPTASTGVANQGLSGRVFTLSANPVINDTSLINFFGTATSTRVDTTINTTNIALLPVNTGVQWIGKLSITTGGAYNFFTDTDDGSRIFIDGVLVLNNDGGKGVITVPGNGTRAPITLAAGLHDIRYDYVNGTGGASATLSYAGPDSPAISIVPQTALFQAESLSNAGASNALIQGAGVGDPLAVTNSSSITLTGTAFTQVQYGTLSMDTGSTLSITTSANRGVRIAGTGGAGTGITLGNGTDGTVTLNTAADVYMDGVISDGGNAIILAKQGAGRLVFDQTTTANALGANTTLDIQGGTLTLMGSAAAGSVNPIGSAKVSLNGGNMVLDPKVGSTTTGLTNNNAIDVVQNATIQDVGNAFTTTLSGAISVSSGVTLTLDAIAGGNPATDAPATLALTGPVTGGGTIAFASTVLNDFGPVQKSRFTIGTNFSGFTGNFRVDSGSLLFNNNIGTRALSLNGGDLAILTDGSNGLGTPENVAITPAGPITVDASSSITVGRAVSTFGGGVTFITASNKTVQLPVSAFTFNAGTLTANNLNGFGLELTGPLTMAGASTSFGVANATASNVVQGLTLSGVVSGTGNLVKTGPGSMVLSNTNTFGGSSNLVDVQAGVVSVATDAGLGDPTNNVRLSATGSTITNVTTTASATIVLTSSAGLSVGQSVTGPGIPLGATIASIPNTTSIVISANASAASGSTLTFVTPSTLRATDSFTTTRTIALNGTLTGSNIIEVVSGKTLQVDTPFSLGAPANPLVKGDNGTLALTQSNTGWTGPITINAGTILVSNNTALGSGQVTLGNAVGAGLQLTGGITVSNPLAIASTGGLVNSGINFGGGLQSVSGVNTMSGAISQPTSGSALLVSADPGATLNINGGITMANTLYMGGDGAVNINSTLATGTSVITKIGNGTATITTPSSAATGQLFVEHGNLVISGAGQLGNSGTGTIGINSGGTLTLDNSTTHNANRLGTGAMTINSGTLNYIGNSSGSAETFGTLTFSSGFSVFNSTPTSGGAITATFTSATFSADSSVTFNGAGLGAGSNKIIFTTAPTLVPATTGILARAIVTSGSGFDFATYDAANGIKPFTAYNATSATDINAAAATDTVDTGPLTTRNITATKTINALKINGSGQTIGGAAGTTLNLTTAAVANTGGNNTLSVPVITFLSGTTQIQSMFHVDAGTTLTVSSTLSGTAGFVKADGGTLLLNPPQPVVGLQNVTTNILLTGTHNINGGTLVLGSNNAITANSFLRLTPGSTLDLNGHTQYVQALFIDPSNGAGNSVEGGAGTVTGVAGSNLIANYDGTARQFSGVITGAINFTRSGQQTQTFYANNDYTGTTLINGGTTSLRDNGRLSGTSAIDINFATLLVDNTLTNPSGTKALTDRVNDAATITMRGGSLNLTGRPQTVVSENFGPIVLAQGQSNMTVGLGGTGVNSSEVTSPSLTRQNGAILNIQTAGGQLGSASRLLFTTPPAMTNNIIPWIHSGGAAPMTYIPGLGLATLGANGAPGFDSTTALPATPGAATQNIQLSNASFTVPDVGGPGTPGTYLLNSLTLPVNAAAQSLNFTDAQDTLNLTSGLLLRTGAFAGNIGATVDSGRLTAGGTAASGTQDLILSQNAAGVVTVNSRIVNNPNGAPVRFMPNFYNGGTIAIANPNNSYTGGTVVQGGAFTGTLNVANGGKIPAGGITLNQTTLTQSVGGVIDPANVVTINGAAVMNLTGANTLAGLAFNNSGGGSTVPSANSFTAGIVPGGGFLPGTGTLTIGASGVTATSSNVSSTALMAGRFDFGASAKTITIGTIDVNGATDVAPLQAALAIQGISGSAGGIIKDGPGNLLLNAQQVFTGPLTVNAGGIQLGVANAGSRYGDLVLNGATSRLNLNGLSTTVGSLGGNGVIFNSSATAGTLTAGFNNNNSNFSGSFTRFFDFSPATVAFTKVGTGTMSITSAQSTTTGVTGALTVNGGGLTFSGAGTSSFGSVNVNSTGTLTLDNSGTNVPSRLNLSAGTLSLNSGNFTLIGNAAGTTENIGNITVTGTGQNVITLKNNGGAVVINAPVFSTVSGQEATLLRGDNLGGTGSTSTNVVVNTTFFNFPTAGTFVPNTTTNPVRIDMIGDTSSTGTGTGFIVRDISAGNILRVINPVTELQTAPALPAGTPLSTTTTNTSATVTTTSTAGLVVGQAVTGTGIPALATIASIVDGTTYTLSAPATASGTVIGTYTLLAAQNAKITAPVQIAQNTTINTLSVMGGSSLTSPYGTSGGKFGPGGVLTLTNSGGSMIALNSISIDASIASGGTTQGYFVPGASTTVTLNGFITAAGGIVKQGDGTLVLNTPEFYTGTVASNGATINGGLLKLNGGNNTLNVVTTATVPTLLGLYAHGGTMDLNGNSQAVERIVSNNTSANTGGVITNLAGGGPVTLTMTNSNGTNNFSNFAGNIQGNLNFAKYGNQVLNLFSPNTYSGSTTIGGSTVTLIDAGTMQNTTSITLNYAGLNLNQSGNNPAGNTNPLRIPAAAPVTMRGSTLTLTPGGSSDSTTTINSVTANEAHNTLAVPQPQVGSIGVLTIGNLVHTNLDSTMNFTGGNNTAGSGFFSGTPGLGNSQLIINTINSTPTASTLSNKILGGWAMANNGEFATYVSSATGTNGIEFGINTLNGFVAYDSNVATFPASSATSNVRVTATAAVPTGGATYNVVALRTASTNITFGAGGDVLNLASGGLALTGGTAMIVGTAATPGVLTAGGTATGTQRLYIYGSTATINSNIQNNPSGGVVRLVYVPTAGTNVIAGTNTYGGGTVVNGAGGTLSLSSTAAGAAFPAGGVTLNNVAVTQTVAGNINSGNDVTLNGGSTLTLTGNNTLSSLTFNNLGGTANPTVATSTGLTLNSSTPITSTNDNWGFTPTVSGTSLSLPASATITASGGSPNDLNITAPVISTGTAMTKQGTGALVLAPTTAAFTVTNTSGTNTLTGTFANLAVGQGAVGTGIPAGTTVTAFTATTVTLSANTTAANASVTFNGSVFTGGMTLSQGTLILNTSTNLSGTTIVSGPVGTGTLTIGGGTAIQAGSAAATIANPTIVGGDFTFAGTAATNNVTLSGAMNLGAAGRTITNNSPLVTDTISGAITSTLATGSTPAITKAGIGILTLSSTANNFNGNGVAVTGGVLKVGAASTVANTTAQNQTFATGVLPATARLAVSAGAEFDMNGNDVVLASLVGDTATTGGLVTNSGAAKTLYIGADNTSNAVFNGIITNAANTLTLVKIGSGNQTLGGNNSFTGAVRINQGSLTITNSGALGAGIKTIDLATNGTNGNPALHLDGSTANGAVIIPSNINFSTSTGAVPGTGGIYNDAGNNIIQGNFTITSGGGNTQLVSNADSLTLTGNLTTITTGRVLVLSGNGTGAISGIIGDATASNALVVQRNAGSGTWTLSGANTYSGATNAFAGTLAITGSLNPAQPATSAMNVNGVGALLQILNPNTSTVSTGAVTVTLGTLQVGAGGIGKLTATGVALKSTGVLTGTGSIAGPLSTDATTAGSKIAPGDGAATGAAGNLTVTGATTFAAGVVLNYDLNTSIENGGAAPGPATGNDLLSVGSLTGQAAGGQLVVNGAAAPGTYHLISYAGGTDPQTSDFNNAWSVALQGGGQPLSFANGDYAFNVDTNNKFVDLVLNVPEPTSMGMVAAGAFLGLLARRRRTRRV